MKIECGGENAKNLMNNLTSILKLGTYSKAMKQLEKDPILIILRAWQQKQE